MRRGGGLGNDRVGGRKQQRRQPGGVGLVSPRAGGAGPRGEGPGRGGSSAINGGHPARRPQIAAQQEKQSPNFTGNAGGALVPALEPPPPPAEQRSGGCSSGAGRSFSGQRASVGRQPEDEGPGGGGGGGGAVGGDPRRRAGEAQRQPLPAVEEEAGGAEQGQPEPLLARGRRRRQGPRQGAALRRHPEGGLRGAHGQVRVLHHRHHGPQGDRLSVPGRELLERLHHHGAHRLPEQARHPGLQEPPGGRRAGGRRRPRQAPRPRPLSPPPAGPRTGPRAKVVYLWMTNKISFLGLNQDRIPMKES